MRREGVGEAELCREFGAKGARAEDLDRNFSARAGNRTHSLTGFCGGEVALQLQHILRKAVLTRWITTQCAQGSRIGSRRAAQAEIDPPRIKRFECAKLFCNHQRR